MEELGTQFDGEPVAAVEEVPTPAEVESAPEATPEPETQEVTEPEGEEEDLQPKKKSGSQRWKEKAQRKEEEAEYWKAQALQNKAPEPIATQNQGEPKQEDFETHADWVKASVRYEAARMLAEEKAKEQATALQRNWQEKAEKAKQKYEDFEEVLETAPMPKPAVLKVLQKSPAGADLAYHLATHPDEYQRINSLDAEDCAYELGQLALKFSESPKPKKPTQAPPPVKPVASSGVVPTVTLHARFEEF